MANGTVGVASVVLKLKDSQKFKQGLQSCKTMFASVGNAIKTIAKGIAIAYGAAIAGMTKFVKEAVNAAKEMESIQLGFKSMLGDQGAKEYTDWLQKFALTSPFESTDLLKASRTLLAFGFSAEQAKATIERLGEAAASTGNTEMLDRVARALGKINAQGKVTAESMMWLTDAGVNGWQYLADGFGKTTQEIMEMSKKGLLDSATTIPMLLKGMETQYAGSMARMAQSTDGQISTMQDTWHQLLVDFGTILLPYVNKAVAWITSALEIITDYINNNKDKIAGFIQGIVGKGLEIGGKIVAVCISVANTIKTIAPALNVIKNIVMGIYNSLVGFTGVIAMITLGLAQAIDMFKAISENGLDKEKWKNWGQGWKETYASMKKDVESKMFHSWNPITTDITQVIDNWGGNSLASATTFFNNFNDLVSKKTREREAELANGGNKTNMPGFGTPKTDTDAILEAYKEMYKKLEEMAKNYRDKLAKWGVSSWATQIFGGVGETMNQVYNATVQKPEEQQIDLLQQIAINTGGIPEQNKFMTMQAIPLEGYNAY